MFDKIKSFLKGEDKPSSQPLRESLHERQDQYLIKKAQLQSHIAVSDEHREILNSQITNTKKRIDKGDDDLIPVFKHQTEKAEKFEEDTLNAIGVMTWDVEKAKESIMSAHLDLMKSLTRYGDYMFKSFMLHNKGCERKNMPQIDDNEKLRKACKLHKGKLQLQELKPYQKEIDEDKVDSFLASGYKIPKEWIVSADNYIMDGHHRWAATLEIFEPETEVEVYKSDLDAEDFHKVLMGFSKGDVSMPFEDFVKEHERLINILLHGTEQEQQREAERQIDEMVEEIEAKEDGIEHYAACIYQRMDGKILFLKRHMYDMYYPNVWNLPAGGIEEGELPIDAAKREFKEETNLDVAFINEAKTITEKNAMIHYFWVVPEDGVILLLDSESQQYEFWDIDEFRGQDLILDLEDHLMQILTEGIEKAEKKPAKGKKDPSMGGLLIPKKVLVKQEGKKPYWQTKWVKAMDIDKEGNKLNLLIANVANKVGIPEDVLLSIADDIEYIVEGDKYYKIDKVVNDKGFNLVQVGKAKEVDKAQKGWMVVVKDDTKIGKKEGATKQKVNLEAAQKIMLTAQKKKKPLTLEGDNYEIINVAPDADVVKVKINGGGEVEYSFKGLAHMVMKQLKVNLEKEKQFKQWNKVSQAIKDEDFTEVKNLGGSTGAKLVKDKNGTLWVRKGGNSKAHRENELLAINLYKHLGVNVAPQTIKTKEYIYNKYTQGVSLKGYLHKAKEEDKNEMYEKIAAGFVVDALLGAWDVIGLEQDNIVVDQAGIPIRIDVGGAMEFRAQGTKKDKAQWEDAKDVFEIDSLRDPKMNPQSAPVFANIDMAEIMKQVEALPTTLPTWVTPKKTRDILEKRIKKLKDKYEGLPTNLEEIGDLYPIPKGASTELKQFYNKLNELMMYTPKDQKLLTMLAEAGDDEAKRLTSEELSTNFMKSHMSEANLKEYNEGLGLLNRELVPIYKHTTNSWGGMKSALLQMTGGQFNIVEKGQVVKYKPEFEEQAKKAFSLNTLLEDKLSTIKKNINIAAVEDYASHGQYGASLMQEMYNIQSMLGKQVTAGKNELEVEIAKHYKGIADGLVKAYESKGTYNKEFEVYIPSDELKEKYAEIVDLSFVSDPVKWENVIDQSIQTKKEGGVEDLKSWASKESVKNIIMVKLAMRAFRKTEKMAGKHKFSVTKPISRKISPGDMNDFLDRHQEGNIVHWSVMNSCSTNFAKWSGSVHTRVTPKGALLTSPFAMVASEEEATLKPFPRLKVVSANNEGGHKQFTLVQM